MVYGVDFCIFSGMTLKDGRQKDYFYSVLDKSFPDLRTRYEDIYKGDKWGSPSGSYYDMINRVFRDVARECRMPVRTPLDLFKDILSRDDLVVVLLEHIDYFLKLKGEKSPFGYVAYSLSQLKEPISSFKGDLTRIKGVGRVTERIVREIIESGSCSYYEKLASEYKL